MSVWRVRYTILVSFLYHVIVYIFRNSTFLMSKEVKEVRNLKFSLQLTIFVEFAISLLEPLIFRYS